MKRSFDMILFALDWYTNCPGCPNFLEFLELQNYSRVADFYSVLFLTDSVLYVLFAYFDESMGSIGGYEPWWSWNTVDIVLILNWNKFAIVPKGSDLLYYTNRSHKVCVKFCGDEVFEERGVTDARRIKRGKSSSLGVPKAPQVNTSRILKHLSLGMPRLASHLSSWTMTGQFWLSLSFLLLHMICAILEMLFYFVLLVVLIISQDLKLLSERESSHSYLIIQLLIDLHLNLLE